MIKKIIEGFGPFAEDPFLLSAHTTDRFPHGDGRLGIPLEYQKGHTIGSDWANVGGFRMYNSSPIPGFPSHPHRGIETVTIVLKGYIDHADSLKGASRFSKGDVQWMTAGSGLMHSEMYPQINTESPNDLEALQLWLNLPRKNKMAPPSVKLIWSDNIPKDVSDPKVSVRIITGTYKDTLFFGGSEFSWAAEPENEVNILVIDLEEGGEFRYPKAKKQTTRVVYFYEGEAAQFGDQLLEHSKVIVLLDSDKEAVIKAIKGPVSLFWMEGKPINEPVAQRGPMVMNSQEELDQAYADFRRTQFGGWPWENSAPVHQPEERRFIRHPDGRIEYP